MDRLASDSAKSARLTGLRMHGQCFLCIPFGGGVPEGLSFVCWRDLALPRNWPVIYLLQSDIDSSDAPSRMHILQPTPNHDGNPESYPNRIVPVGQGELCIISNWTYVNFKDKPRSYGNRITSQTCEDQESADNICWNFKHLFKKLVIDDSGKLRKRLIYA